MPALASLAVLNLYLTSLPWLIFGVSPDLKVAAVTYWIFVVTMFIVHHTETWRL